MHVTSTTVLGLSAAWSAVGLVSDSIAALPIDAVLEEGERRVPVPAELRPRWLDRPGGGLTRIDVTNQAMVSLLIRGEAILLTPRATGEIQGLTVLEPESVTIDGEGNYSALAQPLELGEFVHIRGLMLPGSNRGLSPISYAREAFGSALATQQFGAAFFGNGAWMGTTVEVPGQLSETGQSALKAYIEQRHRGSSNAHKISILTEGAKLGRTTFSPEDSQFLETRNFQVQDIARMFRVPPEMIGGQSGEGALTYTTLEGRGTHFVKFSLLPWIVRLEEAYTQLWRSEGGPENGVIKLNVNGLLRGSTKERYDAYAVALDKGFMTVDEVRALEDLPPLNEETA